MVVVIILLIIFGLAMLCVGNAKEKKEHNFKIINGNLVRNKDLGEWREPINYPKTRKTRSYSPKSYSNSNFSRMRKEALKNVSGLREVKNVKRNCFR